MEDEGNGMSSLYHCDPFIDLFSDWQIVISTQLAETRHATLIVRLGN